MGEPAAIPNNIADLLDSHEISRFSSFGLILLIGRTLEEKMVF